MTPCPACGHLGDPADRYCEACGCDRDQTRPPAGGPPAAPRPAGSWTAVVEADRAHYARHADPGAPFPVDCPRRDYPLTAVTTLVGRYRGRASAGVIDLSGAWEDRGVSHTHALFTRAPDGSLTVTDLGATNGLWVNDGPTAVPVATAVPLRAGDRVYLGTWTRITLYPG